MRYLGDRVLIEAGAELTAYVGGDAAPVWRLRGVAVEQDMDGGPRAVLDQIPALVHRRAHATVRAAVDVELVPGFVWLTGGYAYRRAASPRRRLAPGFGDLGGHTAATGLDAVWDDVTLTVGYARTIAPSARVRPSETRVAVVSPFGGTAPAGAGRYRSGADSFGLSIELGL